MRKGGKKNAAGRLNTRKLTPSLLLPNIDTTRKKHTYRQAGRQTQTETETAATDSRMLNML